MGNIKLRLNFKILNNKLDQLDDNKLEELVIQIVNKIDEITKLESNLKVGIIKSEESNIRLISELELILKNKCQVKIIDLGNINSNLDLYLDCMQKSKILKNEFNILNFLNGKKVISIGLKSGINTNNGSVKFSFNYIYSIYIFYYPFSNFINESLNYLNDFCLLNPASNSNIKLIDEEFVSNSILKRKRYSNKGTYKRVSIIGGSQNYLGSTYLSYLGLASLVSGIGYVNIATCSDFLPFLYLKNPQATLFGLENEDGHIKFNKEEFDKLIDTSFTIVFGIGCGTSIEIYKCLQYLLLNFKGNLIIDADGLNVLVKFGKDILKESVSNVILTPHIGEFARLVNASNQEVSKNMYSYLKEFIKEFNNVGVILKSASSLINYKNKYYLNISGNTGLSKGGSGDLLTGILAGLISNTSSLEIAMCVASYLLGKTSQACLKDIPEISITYLDLVKQLPLEIAKLIKK